MKRTQSSEAKVLVIGGGVIGLSIALELKRLGAAPVILERSIPGAEASSAAAGLIAPQLEAIEPGPFLDLCLASRALYPDFVRRVQELSGLSVGFLPSGVVHAAFDPSSASRLSAQVEWQKRQGLRAEMLDGSQARALEPALAPEVWAAAHFPDDHQVDNCQLVTALSMAAARVGVAFRSGYVRGVRVENHRAIGVDVDGELIRADATVVAAGAWSGLVQGIWLDPRAVRPVRGQMVQLQSRLPLLRSIVCSDQGYLVPRADGRLIAGSTAEHAGFQKEVTAGGLAQILQMATQLCPGVRDLAVTGQWAGLRPFTEDKLPILGRGPADGLFIASGHFRNGILLAPITGELIAALALGRTLSRSLEPFSFERLKGAPGTPL